MHFELMKRGEAPLHRSSTDSSRRGSGTQDPAAESIRMSDALIMGGIALNAVKVDICKVDIQRLPGADRR